MRVAFLYHLHSLLARRATATFTVLVVAAVVGVFTWMLAFAQAMNDSLDAARDPRKLIVLRRGSTSESTSAISIEHFNRLKQAEGIAHAPGTDAPMISPEIMVQIQLPRVADGGETLANVAVRGVTQAAFDVHRNVHPQGRSITTGSRDVIVGAVAAQQFMGLEVGKTLDLGYAGDRAFNIVGMFTAGGGPTESEIWGYLPAIMDAYARDIYSSASLRVLEGTDVDQVKARIDGPAIQLFPQTEAEYWEQQTGNIRGYLAVAYTLVAVMGIAAVLSIANMMFASVSGRVHEIAMLRTVGFSPAGIGLGFTLEALLLSVIGGILGCIGCALWIATVGSSKDMFGAFTFTTLAFDIQLDTHTAGTALASVLIIGLIGTLFPALRGARLDVLTALREP